MNMINIYLWMQTEQQPIFSGRLKYKLNPCLPTESSMNTTTVYLYIPL